MEKDLRNLLKNVEEDFTLDSFMKIIVDTSSKEQFVNYKSALEEKSYNVMSELNVTSNICYVHRKLILTENHNIDATQ